MRLLRTIALVVTVGVFCLAPARAALFVSFDMSVATLDYIVGTKTLTVTESTGSIFDVKFEDDVLGILDTGRIIGGDDFDLSLVIDLIDLPGSDNWAGTGAMAFTDTTTANVAVANFNADDISIVPGAGGILIIEGRLGTSTGLDSILRPPVEPWTFVGEMAIPGEADADGTPGQITVANRSSYDGGDLFVLKFGVPTTSLDTLFIDDITLVGGEVKGTIVPAPAAVVLGMVGLCLIGWRMRRYA